MGGPQTKVMFEVIKKKHEKLPTDAKYDDIPYKGGKIVLRLLALRVAAL